MLEIYDFWMLHIKKETKWRERKMVAEIRASEWNRKIKRSSAPKIPKRNLSYGVVNRAMLLVIMVLVMAVAIMVEMLLTLILNMSIIYKFTKHNWFIWKFIIAAVDVFLYIHILWWWCVRVKKRMHRPWYKLVLCGSG